jgi:prepilin-type N-terminal cleavage/methylation domain-containing protein
MGFAQNLINPFLWRFNLKLFLKSDGFSLIEILIAIVILSISLLALAGLMATTSRNTSFGGHITEAATFAQDRLEQLRVTTWDNIITTEQDPISSVGSTGIAYTRSWTVVSNANDTLKTITITISWTDQAANSFSLISVILNPNQ